MEHIAVAQPDITLHLDMKGLIQDAAFSSGIPEPEIKAWRGRPWSDTVTDVGKEKVARMIEDARSQGVSAFRQVTQRFPSGLELPIEYTAVRVGRKGGLLAVGKDLQATADLQSRLIAAQQAMERDYWKLRDIETRYRLVFDASNEPIVLLRASNLHIIEVNPSAIRALGFSPVGREFLPELAPQERQPFEKMLVRVRERGKAPAVLVHLGPDQDAWMVRASLMTSDDSQAYILQLAPLGVPAHELNRINPPSLDAVFEHAPDAMAIVNAEGAVQRANRAFLGLTQTGTEASIQGEGIGRWLERPGADHAVVLSNIEKHGVVRLLSTTIRGELGTKADVEISAAKIPGSDPEMIAMVIRDVVQRLPIPKVRDRLSATVGLLTEQVGKSPLRDLVSDTVSAVESHYLEAALDLTNGNRTAAAKVLGLSRQSLYAKLNRYGLQESSEGSANRDG